MAFSGLAENTNSIFCDGSPSLRRSMDDWFCERAGTTAERHRCEPASCAVHVRALASAPRELFFP
jgi:hypothetical protein